MAHPLDGFLSQLHRSAEFEADLKAKLVDYGVEDLDDLKTLTEDDVKELKLKRLDEKHFLHALDALKREQGVEPISSAPPSTPPGAPPSIPSSVSPANAENAAAADRITDEVVSDLRRSVAGADASEVVSTRHVLAGQWQKGEKIGQGAFGTVYSGLNKRTGTIIAIKEMTFRDDELKDLESMKKEIELMRKLEHPNIVGYLGGEVAGRTLYIFCEWVAGGSILSLLKRYGKFEETMVRNYARQALAGLIYLHQQHVIHRDIKPDNVLVSPEGVAKLADFGASKQQDMEGTVAANQRTGLAGTPYFMAPEVMTHTTYGRRADVWSFGGLVYQMLTGRPPWRGLKATNPWVLFSYVNDHPNATPLDVEPDLPDMRPELRAFLLRCWNRDAEARSTSLQLSHDRWLSMAFPGCPSAAAESGDACNDTLAKIQDVMAAQRASLHADTADVHAELTREDSTASSAASQPPSAASPTHPPAVPAASPQLPSPAASNPNPFARKSNPNPFARGSTENAPPKSSARPTAGTNANPFARQSAASPNPFKRVPHPPSPSPPITAPSAPFSPVASAQPDEEHDNVMVSTATPAQPAGAVPFTGDATSAAADESVVLQASASPPTPEDEQQQLETERARLELEKLRLEKEALEAQIKADAEAAARARREAEAKAAAEAAERERREAEAKAQAEAAERERREAEAKAQAEAKAKAEADAAAKAAAEEERNRAVEMTIEDALSQGFITTQQYQSRLMRGEGLITVHPNKDEHVKKLDRSFAHNRH